MSLWFSPIKVDSSTDGSGLKSTCTILPSCFIFYSLIHWCCHASSEANQRYWGWRWYFQDSHCMIYFALVYLKRHNLKIDLSSSPNYAFSNHNYNSDCCWSWKFSYSFQDLTCLITQSLQKKSPKPTMQWKTASLMFFPLTAYFFLSEILPNCNSQVI